MWTEHGFDAVLRVWPRVEAHLRAAAQERTRSPGLRLVAVLDIDDTVLQCRGDHCTPVPLGLQAVRALRQLGIPFHYVTARRDTHASEMWARLQLHMLGLDAGCAGFRFMPPGTTDVRAYKLRARQSIAQAHDARVVLNMGDQWTDFEETHLAHGSTPSSHYGWLGGGGHTLCVKAPHRLL